MADPLAIGKLTLSQTPVKGRVTITFRLFLGTDVSTPLYVHRHSVSPDDSHLLLFFDISNKSTVTRIFEGGAFWRHERIQEILG